MEKELIIHSSSNSVDLALLNNGRLVEFHKENIENNIQVGDIYLAKIGKIVGGLNATFVNVGYEKDGFLHYHDLGPKILSQLNFIKNINNSDFLLNKIKQEKLIEKDGKINDVLKSNQSILVQVVKEPISTKGPRLSSDLSIAGRYLVLVPFSERISISQKIEDKAEKSRLKSIIRPLKPKNFGVIAKTVAENAKTKDLEKDLNQLLEKWKNLCSKLTHKTLPVKVYGEIDRASSLIRDVFNDSFSSIYIDELDLYNKVKDYISDIAPQKKSIVKYYNNNSLPIFEKYGIERQKKTSFGKTVSMSKGAYLIIEHTEALHVVDVNSGNRSNKSNTQEQTALEVNLIAGKEIARQLRLRDMGGIIVVDFIDLKSTENKKKLFDLVRDEMSDDRAKHKILPLSKFGLMQITRQRVRPEMLIKTVEKNPSKTNEVEAPIVLIDKIQMEIQHYKNDGHKKLYIHTHPFIKSFITKGLYSQRVKWMIENKMKIKVISRDSYNYLEYHFYDKNNNILK